jgi:hypothetical protein
MSILLSGELFEKVLVEPVRDGANELHLVSGYASPAMVTKHLSVIEKLATSSLSIDMLVGMTGVDGLPKHVANGFRAIPRQASSLRFNCAYTLPGKSIHSKVYVWSRDGVPFKAWSGSANYSQVGFGVSGRSMSHHEVMTEVDCEEAFDYVLEMAPGSIGYLNSDLDAHLKITSDPIFGEGARNFSTDGAAAGFGLATATLPLVQLKGDRGETHQRSGLNWGQRPNRNPDQAYIPVPSTVREAEFFPERGVHFQVVTDDGESFIATIAQAGDKALETPHDNGILGKYFRNRLGLEPGQFVNASDLIKFGSNGVEFVKIEDSVYRMNFSPGINVL